MIRRARATSLLLAAALTALGCRAAATAFGGSPAAARAHGEAFFGAFADRFTRGARSPQFEAARKKLGRHATTPSKIWSDTGVWTASGVDGSRTLTLAGGTTAEGRYRFAERADGGAPRRAGDSRAIIRLHKLGA